MTQSCERLEQRLHEMLACLEAEDAAGAEALVQDIDRLLVSPIDVEHLERLHAIHQRCLQAARRLQESVAAQLRLSGNSRRATGAYEMGSERSES